jgi:hypothetical protein
MSQAAAAEKVPPPAPPTTLCMQVLLVDKDYARLSTVVPSVTGNLSAGHHATLHKAAQHGDELLFAEDKFVQETDGATVVSRLQLLSKQHSLR